MSRHLYASGCHSDLIVVLWLQVEKSKLTTEAMSSLYNYFFSTFGDSGVNWMHLTADAATTTEEVATTTTAPATTTTGLCLFSS